jgi:prolyl-tRNA synthetase
MVPSNTGEDIIIHCHESGYAANQEKAEIGAIAWPAPADPAAPAYEKVATPGKRTIAEVCGFLKVPESASAKLLVYMADGKPVAVLIRGDHEANEAKVRRAFGASAIVPADADQILKATGAPIGFLGPIGLKIPMAVDRSVAAMPSVVVGAGEVDQHFKGVVPGRDIPLDRVLDLRNALEGDPCPLSGKPMQVSHGIEIGHVFKLGTKYSLAMGANFLDEKGSEVPTIMGCYGIGVNRIVASAVEACHDSDGILWPLAIAPYRAAVVPLQVNNDAVMAKAHEIHEALQAAGHDAVLDDREQRPGFKFKDADLVGFPVRVVISERGLGAGTLEIKWRNRPGSGSISADGAGAAVVALLDDALAAEAAKIEERKASRKSGRRK